MTREDFLSCRLDFFQRIARSFLNSRRNSSIRARLRLGASLTVLALVPTAALAQSATSDAAGAPYPWFFLDPPPFLNSWTPPAGAGSAASEAPAADAQAAGASAQPKSTSELVHRQPERAVWPCHFRDFAEVLGAERRRAAPGWRNGLFHR